MLFAFIIVIWQIIPNLNDCIRKKYLCRL